MDLKTNATNRGLIIQHPTKLLYPNESRYQEGYSFSRAGYSYKLVSTDVEKEMFDKLVYNNFHEALNLDRTSFEYTEVINKSRELDEKLDKNIFRFIAYNKNHEAIATVCTYLDNSKLLPGEVKENCNYSDLRKLCNIMEVGRLSIRKDYRLKPLLSCGLNSFIINVAARNKVDIIVESSFTDKINMLIQVGFRRFKHGDSYDRIYKIPKVLCYLNFASKLYGYFNKRTSYIDHELSNYVRKGFEIVGDTNLKSAYEMLIERNSAKPLFAKTFNIDYSNMNVTFRS